MSGNEFVGKVVVITGGASGIGKCLVQFFAEQGAAVHFCDFDREAGLAWEKSLGEQGKSVAYHYADVGVEADARGFAQAVLENTSTVDVLVNNVWTGGFGHSFLERPLEEWNRLIAVGLTSYFLCSQLFSEALENAKGSIVNIASTRAFMSEPDSDPYSAAKGGIIALTHSLAITLGPRGVRVNSISPGWIDVTGWQFPPRQEQFSEEAHRQHPVGRIGRPDDIAEACLFLASSSRAGFITGQNLIVDGGMTRKMIYVE